jgi:undecaprenyl diphosphate synthase
MNQHPKHVAIIMDGNGRWASKRHLPRVAGHQQGVESLKAVITACAKKEISVLTLFAFSSENWQRPESEVSFLLGLILKSIKTEINSLHKNNIRFRIIGDCGAFNEELQLVLTEAELLTKQNTGLQLNFALNYGGRWDIVQATKALCLQVANGHMSVNAFSQLDEATFAKHLSLSDYPDPDLLIRTSGEQRISNFLVWHFAYTELYFTDTFWPDFREVELEAAFEAYAKRQRRFGKTSEQVEQLAS